MRIFKITFFLLAIAFPAFVNAQFRTDVHGSYINSLSKTKIHDVGIGAAIEHSLLLKRFALGLGINYFFPTTFSEDIYAYSVNGAQDSIKLSAEHTAFMVNFPATLKLFLIGDANDDFNVYLLGGAGLWIVPNKSKLSSYDTAVYSTKYGLEYKKTIVRVSVDFGAGLEKKIATALYIFGEVRGDITASETKLRSSIADVKLPNNLIFNAGIRFSF